MKICSRGSKPRIASNLREKRSHPRVVPLLSSPRRARVIYEPSALPSREVMQKRRTYDPCGISPR